MNFNTSVGVTAIVINNNACLVCYHDYLRQIQWIECTNMQQACTQMQETTETWLF